MKNLIHKVKAWLRPAPAPEPTEDEECSWCGAVEPCNCAAIYGDKDTGGDYWEGADYFYDQAREQELERG